ncbi:hypothetical protein MXB_331 [Myxobolus squamalis]|nr:hypothetical protein MXB_331 [Myxobolus squamalis]
MIMVLRILNAVMRTYGKLDDTVKVLYTVKRVVKIQISDDMVAIQQELSSSLVLVWSNQNNSVITPVYPKRLKITDFKQIFAKKRKIYLVVEINKKDWCLFVSIDDTYFFSSKLCGLFVSTDVDICPVYMPPSTEGVIYTTTYSSPYGKSMLISLNDGSKWLPMQLDPPFRECSDNKCTFDLQLPCEIENIDHISPVEGLNIKLGNINIKTRKIGTYFFTTTAGLSWKAVANSSVEALFLNSGSIIFGANENIENFYFSFDEGNSWFFTPTNFYQYQLQSIVSNIFFTRTFITIAAIRKNDMKFLDFITIDVGNILVEKCKDSDYINWSINRNQQGCFHGQKVINYRKKTGVLCKDESPPEKYTVSYNCTCTRDDYEW